MNADLYPFIKQIHVTCAALSISGFLLRGVLMLRASPMLKALWMRVLPHINDTIFLTAAIALAVMSNQLPLFSSWVTAKVVGLLAYIVLGALALKAGRPKSVRVACLISAVAMFGWIVSVALLRHPAGIFSLLLTAP